LGLIGSADDFPLLIFDLRGTGVMFVYLYKQIPFVALMVFTILKNLDEKYLHIAENLGAGPFQILTRVTLPLLAPTIFSAFLITFAFGFGAFEVPYLLGSPARATLPILAFNEYRSPVLSDRPAAMAVNVIISVLSLLLVWLYVCLLNYFNKRGREGGF
jgi:putative spermidine/putrescine transport system permease protein